METLCGIMPKITGAGTEAISKPAKWKRIEPLIASDLKEDGIELIPNSLPEIFAKMHTGESNNGKGIIMIGNPGTGKTRRMKWASRAFDIPMLSAMEIAEAYADQNTDKNDLLRLFCPRWSEIPNHYNDLIIDDLGCEPVETVIYGTRFNVLADVIQKRYDRFPRFKTHFTTNLTKKEILSRYGERVFSRLNEMCCFIALTGKDRRMK